MPLRLLDKIVTLRKGEGATAWLMFAYSFLAMTSHNIVKPITRSKVISAWGSVNLPYVLFMSGVIIVWLMYLHSRATARLPQRAIIPATQAALVVALVVFWLLLRTGSDWVPVAFFVFAQLFGVLLISQFWTLANDIYDARQARRIFGFIGGGASLGGAAGGSITANATQAFGTTNLLLVSAGVLACCAAMVMVIMRRVRLTEGLSLAVDERGVGAGEALDLLRRSRHLKLIAAVIGCAAIGGTIVEQQLNMAADALKTTESAITIFLAQVTVYLSLISFVVQVGLTSRIHRSLGLTFALLLLPVSLGSTAIVILTTGALWAVASARVLDTSLRYTVDKTSREVLFLPLPGDLKQRAKPFVDVTVDRFMKGAGALSLVPLINTWGFGLSWRQVSYVSLTVMSVWIMLAFVARREYLRSFRKSLVTREMEAETVRVDAADAATIETLIGELSSPDDSSVLYAIEMLETLDKRHLITPLLLHHESPRVRARALVALEALRTTHVERWVPAVRRMLRDADVEVRAAAVRALSALEQQDAPALMRQHLDDAEPRVALTAAVALADSGRPGDASAAEATLTRIISDSRRSAAAGRREAAAALAHIRNPSCRSLLVPLIHDPEVDVAREAIASARVMGASDALFVPALVSRLGHRILKGAARETLVSYGDDVVAVLAHFLRDQEEYPWVRRHVPATLTHIPTQASMDALVAALGDPDGFLRYKVIEAIETLRREHPNLKFESSAIEARIVRETGRYCTYLTLGDNLTRHNMMDKPGSLLVRSLDDKLSRTLDRIYRLVGLLYPWKDVAAARYSIEQGDAPVRARALEYLDNLLGGTVRRRVIPLIDEAPLADKVRHANSVLRTRPRDLDDTLAQLLHDDDAVVAASAIDFVSKRGRWTNLADDVDYILKQPSADPIVMEAAVWAVDARERAQGNRPRAHTPLPAVELADRLRAIPLFSFVSIDEVFRIARTARQIQNEKGRHIVEADAPTGEIQFLLEGSVRVTGNGSAARVITAPAVVGLEDVLEGRVRRQTITALDHTVCLTLRAPEFLTMLSDNITVAEGLFRLLLAEPRIESAIGGWAAPANEPDVPMRSLEPVEKALRLRQHPLFGRATVEQLLDLVSVTRDVPLPAGNVVIGENAPPSVLHILRGEVKLDGDGVAPRTFGPGATIGLAETLAGTSRRQRATVVREGLALRIEHDALFEVLGDHIDLLQGVFSGVLNAAEVR